ncbi:hypothetical protein HK098_005728 [Nowakowskiella sp. JEL0407]|nr:hypothetical protein HK098_005728 [Nowakowskiella sp. JEL0407]
MVFGLNKIKQPGEKIPVVEDDCTYLRLVIERYLRNISRDFSKEEQIDVNRGENKSSNAWKEMIDYLLETQFDDLKEPSYDEGRTSCGVSKDLDPALALMTNIVEYGVNPNQVCNGSTLAEVLLRSYEYSFGSPVVTLRLIEWLALESNVFC